MFQGIIKFSNGDPEGTWTSRGNLKCPQNKNKVAFVIAVTTLTSRNLVASDRTTYLCQSSSSNKKNKPRGLSPHANYTDRAAAAGRRS